ncbi:MAG: LPS-assembly protein LptD [Burkholderiales bacterium]
MSCPRARLAVLVLALLPFCGALAQQGAGLQPRRSAGPAGADSDSLPLTLDADRIEGVSGKETSAQGKVTLRRGDILIRADSLKYNEATEDVEANGNVRLEKSGDVLSGPTLKYHMRDSTGIVDKPEYSFAPRARAGRQAVSARGQAESIELIGENRFRITDGSFTSCKPGDDGWLLRADVLDLDFSTDVGKVRGGSLYFEGVHVATAPFFEFSLNNRRKSGLLPPSIGTTGKSGPEFAIPYYLNLAPNYDLTLTPRYMEKRGLQIAEQFRYLQANYGGEFKAEVLPRDRTTDRSRSALSLVHSYDSGGALLGGVNLNQVSDDNYFRDLATRINITSQATLPREGFLTYNGSWWRTGSYSATARVQRFQVLQDPDNPIVPPYGRTPQLSLSALRQGIGGFDFGNSAEFVDFSHPSLVNGRRTTIYPSLSYPLVGPGAFLIPKFGVHYSYYSLQDGQAPSLSTVGPVPPQNSPGTPDTIRRTLPIFSLDGGLIFDRAAEGTTTQTLEPRLYYVRIPFREQNQIPLFDTALADFNYAQIFSENMFSGGDRINDADQITVALTSRTLRAATGQELLRGTIGQRYYFKDQEVTLNRADAPRTSRSSDWLAAVSGRVTEHLGTEAALQYNQRDRRSERLTFGGRYQPEPLKTVNLSYRFLRDQIRQVDLSGQWPLGGRWFGIGRFNYSLSDSRIVEGLAGFEYGADCWTSRMVAQRFALTAGSSSSAVFIQLELNGFSRLGSNPLETLKRNVPGYRPVNAPPAEASPDRPFDFYE